MFDNKRALKALMMRKNISSGELSTHLQINPSTLTRKMCGKTDFTLNEIKLIRDFLSMSDDEFNDIFFKNKLA